jgi:haloacetate dehalogenase
VPDDLLSGFDVRSVDGVHVCTAGDGPPVLLLHGYPQTHVMWHRVAPGLARTHTVVCPDLRGYGASHKPPAGEDCVNYAKRTMAAELVDVMAALGHDRFAVVGHDRGGRVAYRMALDHPERVSRLAVLDIVPTIEQWDTVRGTQAVGAFHWLFLAQPAPFPERLIGEQAGLWLEHLCSRWASAREALAEAMPHYLEAFTAEMVRATCDDYRAGAGIDVRLDAEDRDAGRRITCPVLVLWGDPKGRRPSLLEVWRRWADDVSGRALPCGHFLAEEAPADTLDALAQFLA